MNDDFKQCIMKCLLLTFWTTAFVIIFDIIYMFVSTFGKQPADCNLKLCQNRMLNYVNTLPSGGINLVSLQTCLCHSHEILAKLVSFTHTMPVY